MIKINKKQNQYPAYLSLLKHLVDYNYKKTNLVYEKGDFAVRGSIIDIFPHNHSHPIRIEYFDNDIDRLNSFDIHTQRSLTELNHTIIEPFQENKEFEYNPIPNTNLNIIDAIQKNSFVVHEEFGIGLFKGLERKKFTNKEVEYVIISYKNNDKVYVPLHQLDLVHPYSAGDYEPQLNSLSDSFWKKTTQTAKKATEDLAEDVYELYKERIKQVGFAFIEDSSEEIELVNDFEHKLTPDQARSIKEIKQDMESNKPMDRLLCGDVGYGKTEVLIQATFKAFKSKKQTCILVPTTILAEQHFLVFKKRLEKFNCKVDLLSRFRSKEEQKTALKNMKHHNSNVIIGTHRLLQPDIEFNDLGLLIIDEEQRFGVNHKEKIKKLKTNIDVISVSATPIPRTLYMSLTGTREFSEINTPPTNRKSVSTFVHAYNDKLVQNAIQQELDRNGQIFYLLNNIEQLNSRKKKLEKFFPQISIEIAHGRLHEKKLKEVMKNFKTGKTQLIICTTIIENGLDLPNANSIIIENAENYGLAQIHQIRGRVGRSQKQGFAYLFYKSEYSLNEKAKKRLTAIKEYALLGSGYKLALKDLEIRGSGSLLGKKQHGKMIAIGFELYCKLLTEAINKKKGIHTETNQSNTIIQETNLFINPGYIENERERLAAYRRLINCDDLKKLEDLRKELRDRYGELPLELIKKITQLKNYI